MLRKFGWLIASAMMLAVSAPSHALCGQDVDGNGRVDAATDGLLTVRYLLGFRGAALTTAALGPGASRTAADIAAAMASPCIQAGWVGGGTGRLNDTGITWGGGYPSGNNATCTGDNIAAQDCSKGRDANAAANGNADGNAGFNFTKISNAGNPLPSTAALGGGANDWACTFDNVTGLMWEVKTTDGGLRYQAHTYSWFSSDGGNNGGATGTTNGGTCAPAGNCDTEKYTVLINTSLTGLCGHKDWRMPHLKELESIVDRGGIYPAIDGAYFPNTPASFFWAGTPYAASPADAWYVDFSTGQVLYGGRSFGYRVRLVRAGP